MTPSRVRWLTWDSLLAPQTSVAAAQADVFHIWRTRAAMNLKISVQIDEIRSRWVLCQL
jgi:hypothetical protein